MPLPPPGPPAVLQPYNPNTTPSGFGFPSTASTSLLPDSPGRQLFIPGHITRNVTFPSFPDTPMENERSKTELNSARATPPIFSKADLEKQRKLHPSHTVLSSNELAPPVISNSIDSDSPMPSIIYPPKYGSRKARPMFRICIVLCLSMFVLGVALLVIILVYKGVIPKIGAKPGPRLNLVAPAFSGVPLQKLVISGNKIIYANGTEFYPKGVNTGAWFAPEGNFTGMANMDNDFQFFNISDSRWGEQTTLDLMNLWIDNFFSDIDFQAMKAFGFNYIRLGVHYRNFQWANTSWILLPNGQIDFTRLDTAISRAAANGLYVLLDFHIWYGRDVLYEGISKAEPWNDAASLAWYQLLRDKAAEFHTALVTHVRGNSAILGIELFNEPVPSYDNVLSQQMYSVIRRVDPTVPIVRHFGIDQNVDPAIYDWTNIIYGFHVYDFDATMAGMELGVITRTKENWPVPYLLSEIHLTDPNESRKMYPFLAKRNLGYALWTYKAVNNNNWAFINYDETCIVDMKNDPLTKIQQIWRINLPYSTADDLEGKRSYWSYIPL